MAIENPLYRPWDHPASPSSNSWGEKKKVWNDMTEAHLTSAVISSRTTIAIDAAGELAATTGVVAVDTYLSAASDDLKKISLDLPEGRVLLIMAADAARPVTVRHQSVDGLTDGEIDLEGDADLELTSTRSILALQRVGNRWGELWRSGGALARNTVSIAASATLAASQAALVSTGGRLLAQTVLVSGTSADVELSLGDTADLVAGMSWQITIDDGVTDTVTIKPVTAGNAALEDGQASYAVISPIGGGIRRRVLVTLEDVGASWTYSIGGDVVPVSFEYVVPYAIAMLATPTQGDHLARLDDVTPALAGARAFSGTTETLLASDNALFLRFTGSSACTLTLPGGFADGFSCVLRNAGTATVTCSATGTQAVAAGETVTIRRDNGLWLVTSPITENDLTT